MYLKSIEMYGFKSFAERTKIEFDESITCIVGPNGSGKSNITDAIKWVLGEQSSRTLRGDKMEDVIFSGTNNRRSLGLAEVIITFDNSSSTIDLDYTEIQVKRRLYKNGESEYYINNNSCRLKDVRELFMDTGIGKDGYSIIGQGRIDEILSNKPEDRRAIFEEASGISKYKFQKLETEKKIKKTEDNLIRLKDIISELRNQESGLKSEAQQAREYNEIYSELKAYDIYSNTKDYLKLHDGISTSLNGLQESNLKKSEIEFNIFKLNEDFENTKNNLDNIEFQINELQISNIENIKKEKDIKSKIEVYEERLTSKKNELLTLKERIENLNSSRTKIERELEDLTKSNSEILALLEDSEHKYEELDKNLEKKEADLKEKLEDIASIDTQIRETEKQFNEESINYERGLSLDNDRKNRISEIEKSILDLQNSLDLWNLELEKLSTLKKNIELKIETAKKNRLEYVDVQIEHDNNLKILNEDKNKVNLKVSSLENKINYLKLMDENYEGYNKAVKNLYSHIKKNSLNIKGLHDSVANVISVPKKYEKAITSALGFNSQSLIVDDTETAKYIIEVLRKFNFGRITFHPLDSIKSRTKGSKVADKSFVDYASNLVNFDPIYTDVIDNLLGYIIVVENMDSAVRISRSLNQRVRIVTLEGDIINPGSSITGGSLKVEGGILHRKNEITDLTTELDNAISDKQSIEQNISKILSNTNVNKKKITELEQDINYYNIELEKNNIEIIEINSDLKNTHMNLNQQESQLHSISSEVAEFKEKTIIRNEFEQFYKEKLFELQKLKDINNVHLDDLNISISELRVLSEELRINISNYQLRISNINNGISKATNDLNEINDQLETSIHKKTLIIEENENIEKSIIQDKKNLETIILENSEFKGKNETLLVAKREILKNYENSTRSINEENSKLLNIEKDLYNLDTSIKRDQVRLDSIKDYISEGYNFSLLEDLIVNVELKKLSFSMTIKEMKQKLSLMGNINHSAITQYKNLMERLEFNEEQYSDLVETKSRLEKMLDEIQVVMKEKFLESFNIINKNFKEIFSIMFSGGSAEVVMSESDNILETGIEIITQPPGKRRQSLNLMSGGERSLTAVSLLFALLKTKPAPFCLLDEIDAALDDANIKRFVSYLSTLENIQFAIITHRKPTMEVADYIYGITMEETGVSKVVSIKFNERKVANV